MSRTNPYESDFTDVEDSLYRDITFSLSSEVIKQQDQLSQTVIHVT